MIGTRLGLAALLVVGPASGPAIALDMPGAALAAEAPPSEAMPQQKPDTSRADVTAPSRVGAPSVDPVAVPAGPRVRPLAGPAGAEAASPPLGPPVGPRP